MQTLYRLISLSTLLILILSACSGIVPQVVQGQALPEDSISAKPARTETAPKSEVTPAIASPAIPTKPPAGTPVSTEILAHPEGCSPASLGQSVLSYTWSDRKRQHSLSPVEAATGQPLCNYEPISIGWWFVSAFSPQGDRLALTVSDREDGWESSLHWIDLKSWQLQKTSIEFPKFVVSLNFSPDGQKLAITAADSHVYNYQIVIVDPASQSVLAETKLDFYPRLVRFTGDGSAVAVYGSPDIPNNQETTQAKALLLDSATLESLWQADLTGVIHGQIQTGEGGSHPEDFEVWEPAVVYAPLEDKLYIVHADADRLTGVDFIARRTRSVDIIPATSWLERLLAWTAGVAHAKVMNGFFKTGVLSPDGSRLYVLGRTDDTYEDSEGELQFKETHYGLKVIDVATGAEVAHLDTDAAELDFSADGRKLFLRSWVGQGLTEVLDADSLDVISRQVGRQLTPGRRLDGKPVLLSINYHPNGQTTLGIVDPVTFEEISKGWTTLWASWLVER